MTRWWQDVNCSCSCCNQPTPPPLPPLLYFNGTRVCMHQHRSVHQQQQQQQQQHNGPMNRIAFQTLYKNKETPPPPFADDPHCNQNIVAQHLFWVSFFALRFEYKNRHLKWWMKESLADGGINNDNNDNNNMKILFFRYYSNKCCCCCCCSSVAVGCERASIIVPLSLLYFDLAFLFLYSIVALLNNATAKDVETVESWSCC